MNIERNPTRIIYSSSLDRGLIYLLNNWQKIQEGCPKAELHVFYGFDVFDALHRNNPSMMKWKEHIMELLKQPGITYHGRVGHKELEEEMLKAGIWAYPTDFDEISCITAMKSQALGAIPVVTNRAALQETVKNGIKIDGDILEEDVQEAYVKALVGLLNNPAEQEDIRKTMMPWAKEQFPWKRVAADWDRMLRSYLQNPEIILEEKHA